MDERFLTEARSVACLMGTRIQIVIPSILAEGERFCAKISVTGADALPKRLNGYRLCFDGSVGIEGLPQTITLDANRSFEVIEGLTAKGPHAACVRAQVERADVQVDKSWVTSNPAWVFEDPPYRLFWGDLHVHTTYSNCHAWRCLDPEWCYQYARDVSCLDFVAAADHLHGIAAVSERWAQLQELARHYYARHEFVTFLAFESSHAQGYGGDNNAYYLDDDAPYFWLEREDMHGSSPQVGLEELWEQLDGNGKKYFTVPHHTGRAHKYRAWTEDYYDGEREPLFEIYSSWGSSEMRHSRFPISGGNNDAASYFVDALKAGARFGVIASSDDHATLPGGVHHFRMNPYGSPSLNGFSHKGLAAVRAPELTREALFTAMKRRNTYATTQSRSLIDVTLGDGKMGQEIPVDRHLGKSREVRCRFTLDGSTSVRVVLMRNGEQFDVKHMKGEKLMTEPNEVIFVDNDPIESIALSDTRYHSSPFVVYYVRLESGDGAHQWSSPIWIDLL